MFLTINLISIALFGNVNCEWGLFKIVHEPVNDFLIICDLVKDEVVNWKWQNVFIINPGLDTHFLWTSNQASFPSNRHLIRFTDTYIDRAPPHPVHDHQSHSYAEPYCWQWIAS